MAANKQAWEQNKGLALYKQQGSLDDLVVNKSLLAYNLKNLTIYECDIEVIQLLWNICRDTLEKLSFSQFYQSKDKE